MASFTNSLLTLSQEGLPRSYIIQGIYDKIINAIKFTKNDFLVEQIQFWLDDRFLDDYESYFYNWFNAPDIPYWHDYDLIYDISVIVSFILPYYIDYTLEPNSWRTMDTDIYRIIQPLTDDMLPPVYAVYHVNCMLDLLLTNCLKKSSYHSLKGFNQAQKESQLRHSFKHYYLTYQAQNPDEEIVKITEKAIKKLEFKFNREIAHDEVKGFATKLNKQVYLVPQRQIQILGGTAKPTEHQIHIRHELKIYIKKMNKIQI